MTAGFGDFDTSCHGKDGEHRREHKWQPVRQENRVCVNCGVSAGLFFQDATAARTAFFNTLKAPASAHGKAKKS